MFEMKLPTRFLFSGVLCVSTFFYAKSQTSNWDPNAGLWPSPIQSATITASSTDGSATSAIIDNDESSGWHSESAFPSGFMDRSDKNIFLNLPMQLSFSSPITTVKSMDGNIKTPDNISAVGGKAWMRMDFNSAHYIHLLSLKSSSNNGDITIKAYFPNGDSIVAGTYTTADHYSLKKLTLDSTVAAIKLISNASFSLFEIAALDQILFEDVVTDFGSPQQIGWIYTCFHNSQWIDSVHFDVSNDSTNWATVAKPRVDYYFTLPFAVRPLQNKRYARLRLFIKEQDYAKAELFEFDIRDQNGTYGPMPTAAAASRPISQLMGINGIRGWGHEHGSQTLTTSEGAYLYNKVASCGRNYQNMSWDTQDPDITPDYSNMPGGLKFTWLNWDTEYNIWDSAGLAVEASIQFLNSSQPQSTWNNPYQAAYNYGYSFAHHFGPTHGVGNVEAMEIGNEPWDYNATFYRTVLKGMAEGAKAADTAMKVFSCALQAADPSEEKVNSGNYIGQRLTATEAPFLDGINSHHYSYAIDNVTGKRIGTYPENPLSTFRQILSDLRFRNANMPGKEYRLTEWGWGSDGAGQFCTVSEGVSETAQALYAARGLFMLDRLGVDKAFWYFYGNLPGWGSVYSRCGLTGTVDDGSPRKKSFYAFQMIMEKMGNSYFLNVLHEDDNGWAYLYGDSLGNPTYAVAWKPIEASDNSTSSLNLNLPAMVDSTWAIDGTPGGTYIAPPTMTGKTSTVQVSATPVLLKLGAPNTVGLGEMNLPAAEKPKMDLYPNPNNGVFHVSYTLPFNADISINIYTVDGRLVSSSQKSATKGKSSFEMANLKLPKGYYFLETFVKSSQNNGQYVLRKKMLIAQ